MVVYNLNTVLQLMLAGIPALIAMGIAKLTDGDVEKWVLLTGATSLILIDALWRLAAVRGGDGHENKEDAVTGPLALVMPSGGGHIMFLPNWLMGGLVIYGTLTGFIS